MGDIFDGLDVEAYDRQYTDAQLVRRILRYFAHQRRQIGVVTATVILSALSDTARPVIISQGVNVILGNSSPAVLAALVVIFFVTACSSWGTNYVRRRASGRAIGNIVREMRNDAFGAAVSRDMSFYDEFPSGKIVSRITSDTQEFAQVVVLVTDLISQIVLILILFVLLLFIEWRLALLLAAMSPFFIIAALLFRQAARNASRQASRILANVNNLIEESVTGINVAKNFRQEAAIYSQFDTVNRQAYTIYLRRGRVLAMIFPTLNSLAGIMMAILLYFGAGSTVSGAISAGAWYLFIQSVWYFWDPLTSVASFWSQLQAGLASAERVFALIDAPTVVVQTADEAVPTVKGEIEFDNLQFRYSEKETVLPGLSLHIRPGETIAFVGHTGAGKSSIARLVARFYEFQGGALRIDGRDIRTLDLPEYRRHLGIVSQVPFLFAGTIADNIRYARPEATDAEVEDMARRIGGGEWLDTLPDGLQTEVGERGGRLSMGQRQLVALTRVLVQNPSIFILDEATASIDPFTEAQIQEALSLILARSTSILIAHRLSTVRAADRIVVLRKGQIIEEGNHDALLAAGGHYAELYNTYFRHQSLAYIENARSTLTAM